MIDALESLLLEIGTTPALENPFYRDWMSRQFTLPELRIFARNYGAWVKAFPDALAFLLAATDDLEAKTEYAKTLYSEMGYGNSSKVHSVLLNTFCGELARQMGQENELDAEVLAKTTDLLPSTTALIEGERALYQDHQVSFGAQLALEWQAYTMLRKLYDGARNYMSLWADPDKFHEACEYFYAHIGATEKEHKEESLSAVKRYAVDEESVARMAEGYNRHLELIADFWRGMHGEINGLGAQSGAAA